MTRTVLLVAGFIASGLVGGLCARVLFPGEAPRGPAPAGPDRVEARLADLAARLGRLEDEARRAPVIPLPPDAAPLPTDRPAGPPAAPEPAMVPEAQIEEKVRATVEEIAREEREARERRAAVAQVEKEEEWLTKIRRDLLLDDYQTDELRKLMVRRREALAAYQRTLAERGADITEAEKAVLQQGLTDLGAELDRELRSILSTAQYDALMKRNAAAK